MRVGIDIDGVLADFNAAYIQRCIDVTGRDLFPARPFDITTWNYPESYGYTNAEVSAVWDSIKQDGMFWANLRPYNAVGEIIAALRGLCCDERHDTYFITSRPGRTAKAQTEAWLDAGLGLMAPTVIISSEKGECAHALGLSHYVDDRVENCADVVKKSPATACFMLRQPWNHEVDGVVRIGSLIEFFALLQ